MGRGRRNLGFPRSLRVPPRKLPAVVCLYDDPERLCKGEQSFLISPRFSGCVVVSAPARGVGEGVTMACERIAHPCGVPSQRGRKPRGARVPATTISELPGLVWGESTV